MGTFTRGDTSSMPPVMVSRETHGKGGVRITIEWSCNGRLHTRVVDLTSDDLGSSRLSKTVALDEMWSVDLFQHPRAGRRAVFAMHTSRDRCVVRGLTVVDRETELIAVEIDDDHVPRRPVDGTAILRPFRSDLSALRGRRLRVIADVPTDDTSIPQPLPQGPQDVIAETHTIGPGLTVAVRSPRAPETVAHVAWHQLAFYDEPSPNRLLRAD